MAFSFGQPPTTTVTGATGSSGGFSFGGQASTTGTGLFGAANPAPAAGAGTSGLFGTSTTSTSGGFGGFGSIASGPATATATTTASATVLPAFSFGQAAPSAPAPASGFSLGGGFGQPAATTIQPPSIFGAAATGTAGPAATQAVAPLFGTAASSSGANIFGQTTSVSKPSTGFSLFGNATQAAVAAPATTAPALNLFGTQPVVPTTTAGGPATVAPAASMFGNVAQPARPQAPAFSFGNSATAAPTSTQPSAALPLFGGVTTSANTAAPPAMAPSGGFFGTGTTAAPIPAATAAPTLASAGTLFGGLPRTTAPASTMSNLFASQAAPAALPTTAAAAPTAGGLSLFGQHPVTAAPATGGMFGMPSASGTTKPPLATGATSSLTGLLASAGTSAAPPYVAATTVAAPAFSTAPALSFGPKPPAPPAASISGGLFGFGAPSAPAPAATGFSVAPAAPTASTAPPSYYTIPGFQLPAAPAHASTATVLPTLASVTSAAPPAGSLPSFTAASVTTAPSLVPAGGLFAPPATSAATIAGGGSTGPGFSFGPPAVAPLISAMKPPATTASGLGFGITGTPAVPKSTAIGVPQLTSQPTLNLTLPAPAINTTTAVAGITSVAPPVETTEQMTYQRLEELLNKWTVDLEEQERTFLNQATQVNAWDRVIVENGTKIVQLRDRVDTLDSDQKTVDHEINMVASQQAELAQILDHLELKANVNGVSGGEGSANSTGLSFISHADVQRQQIMDLAVNVDAQIKQIGQDLSFLLEQVNENQSRGDTDPIDQISQILGRQMDNLQWLDQQTGVMEQKLQDVTVDLNDRMNETGRIVRHS